MHPSPTPYLIISGVVDVSSFLPHLTAEEDIGDDNPGVFLAYAGIRNG
ncbi:hypothetical protein [Sphingobium tyrosinilyticum]|jgi:hypothetical protein|uniref:Uncharacterized protein n=1 Tax=Sphingobium tyrosinilyticum TaxID=2715436 RepID=A0ABV9EZE6_9SPHN